MDGPDYDGDVLCDAGDADDDNDNRPDATDSDPFDPLVCADTDGDLCDDCSSGFFLPGNDGADADGDGICDLGDPCPLDDPDDTDGDGVCDSNDICPFDNPDDTDGDGQCDSNDPCPLDNPDDTDGDGVCDSSDPCPLDFNDDSDGDGVCDSSDPCPADNPDDTDGDGLCDSNDPCPLDNPNDTDGDGVCDSNDPCPLDNPNDTDGDGVCDSNDPCPLDSPDDTDGDGVCDSDDVCPGDDSIDDNANGIPDDCEACPPGSVEHNGGCFWVGDKGATCSATCAPHGGFDAVASQHTGNGVGSQFFPGKADGFNWVNIECSSTDNNTNFGATGAVPDPLWSFGACHPSCACNERVLDSSDVILAGPHVENGVSWYLSEVDMTCDETCAVAGGTNLAWEAEDTLPASCGGAGALDISRWFYNNGNPGSWTGGTGGTGGHTLGYGYTNSNLYGACPTGGSDVGSYPGDINTSATRNLVCACDFTNNTQVGYPATSNWVGTGRMRGNVYTISEHKRVFTVAAYLDPQVATCNIDFYIYQGVTPTGPWSLMWSDTKNYLDAGEGEYRSPLANVDLYITDDADGDGIDDSGYYMVTHAWDCSARYYRDSGWLGVDTALGSVFGEVWYNNYPGYNPAFDGNTINVIPGDNAYTHRLHTTP